MRPHTLAAVALTLSAACVVQTPDPSSGDRPDATTADAPPNNTNCIPAATPPGDGHHNAGANCLGCHTGNGAPRWTAAGTLYNLAGTAPVAGATITLIDSANKSITIVSATNGNFWTTEALQMPLRVRASKCPSAVFMSMQAPAGACNSCHSTGGNPGRIKMP
jgi:hypothetical protein